MKKYIILMKEKEEGLDIQRKLVQVGFTWGTGEKAHHPTSTPYFLFINSDNRGILSYTDDFVYTANDIKRKKCEVLQNVSFSLADAFALDGAKLPEKMITVDGKEFSESTLIAALKQYVE